jgi:hypothetical protein
MPIMHPYCLDIYRCSEYNDNMNFGWAGQEDWAFGDRNKKALD